MGRWQEQQNMARYPFPRRMSVDERTANKTVELSETGTTFTNKGASGTVTFTLPSNARGREGAFYRFEVEAAQTLRIDPSDSLGFIIHGAQQTDGNWIQSNRIGDAVTVAANSDGDWLVTTDPVAVAMGEYFDTPSDKRFFVAPRPYQVLSAKLVPDPAGTDTGAVTVMISKDASGDDIGAGDDVLSAALDLKGTVDTTQEGSLTATMADRRLAEGDALSMDFTGTTTAAVGVVAVELSTWLLQ